MSDEVKQSVVHRPVEHRIRTRTTGSAAGVAKAVAVVAVLVATIVYAQDKYSLTSPGGIAFSDFRGYEDWSVVSSARTDEVLKVIVGSPAMIKAYKAGVPGNGQPSRRARGS